MPSWAYWLLIASIFVALIIMVVAFLITRRKINKVKEDYLAAQGKEADMIAAVDKRTEHQQYLWDLLEKTEKPMPTTSLEYALNTAIRNKYKKIQIVNGSKYEEESFVKLADCKVQKKNCDCILYVEPKGINENFDKHYSEISKGGMIIIGQANKKDEYVKKLLKHLNITGIRHEYLKMDKGLIFVAK